MNASFPPIEIKAVADLALSQQGDLLNRWFPQGTAKGKTFKVGNIHGDPGESLKINIQTGEWKDFASDLRGTDLVSLYAAIHSLSQIEAARQLSTELGGAVGHRTSRSEAIRRDAKQQAVADWTPIVPVPDDAPAPPNMHPRYGRPTHIAEYRNRAGQLIGYILRCEPNGERKQVPSLTFCKSVYGRSEWQWKALPRPRSLYGTELLDDAPDLPVLLVEGEPKCDAARRMLGERMLVMAWPGGASAVGQCDWIILENRIVLIWPDADGPGFKAANDILGLLHGIAASACIVKPPAGVAEKWDLADAESEGWTGDQIMEHCGLVKPLTAPNARRWAGLDPIHVVDGEIDLIASAGERALIASKMPIFRRDKILVRPVSQMVPASGGRMTVAAGLDTIGPDAMIDLLNQAVAWDKWYVRERKWVPCDPPPKVANMILSRAPICGLPPIAGVITTPTLRPDGSVLSEPGYDAVTRLYHVPDPTLRLPEMPERPTKLDADRAIDLLSELLVDFPFEGEASRPVALSAIITSVVRGAISVAPLHAFRASTAGSGKSYLADIVSMIATGRPCPVMAVAEKDDETEKRLVGMLLAGFPIISLDNVNGELGGDLLCQAIERPLVRARPLGGSEIIEIESRATFIATGNALRVRGDMTRRTLLCTLNADAERPELREFSGNPAADVAGSRGKYVAAALTIVRAYLAAGKPGDVSPVASFEEWNAWVRGSLLWLGCGDPVRSMEEARADDPELSELRELLGCWKEAVGVDRNITVRELDEMTSRRVMKPVIGKGRFDEEETRFVQTDEFEHPDFRESLLKIAGDRNSINARRLGKWLQDKEGRIADGLRITRNGLDRNKVAIWRLSSVCA